MRITLSWVFVAIAFLFIVVMIVSCAKPPERRFTTRNLYEAICIKEGQC